jgi:hypothetical protein
MLRDCVGVLFFIVGLMGMALSREIEFFCQMMEHTSLIVGFIACVTGVLIITVSAILGNPKIPIVNSEISKQISITPKEDLLAEANRIHAERQKKLHHHKESKIKLGKNIPKDTKGLIVDI